MELIPELELDPEHDLVMNRVHGLTPFGGTELDPVLRNLGVRTLIPVGVSVNVAILGTCLAASDLGYQIVLPTDAVIGIPESYADQVFTNTLSPPGDGDQRRRRHRRLGLVLVPVGLLRPRRRSS